MIQAGKLRHRLVLQSPTVTRGSMGDAGAKTWAVDATVWGSVRPLRGRERFAAQQVSEDISHSVTLRYRPGVTSDLRVLFPMGDTLLEGALNTTGTTIGVDSASEFPQAKKYRFKIDDEIMEATAGQGTTGWTVTRGMDGTSASTHNDDSQIFYLKVLDIESVLVDERKTELQLFCMESL